MGSSHSYSWATETDKTPASFEIFFAFPKVVSILTPFTTFTKFFRSLYPIPFALSASADPFCHSFDLPFCSKIAG